MPPKGPTKKSPSKKGATKKTSAAKKAAARIAPPRKQPQNKPQTVDDRLKARNHPLRREVDALRTVVRGASPAIRERWKWNAPSFYADAGGKLDPADVPMERNLATVNLHKTDHVMLVLTFYHGIPAYAPGWLEGGWKDRRLATFRDAADIRARAKELQALLVEMARRSEPA